MQQGDEESWHKQMSKIGRLIGEILMKSFSFNSIRSVFLTNLDTSSRQKRIKVEYKIDTGSDGNLMQLATH